MAEPRPRSSPSWSSSGGGSDPPVAGRASRRPEESPGPRIVRGRTSATPRPGAPCPASTPARRLVDDAAAPRAGGTSAPRSRTSSSCRRRHPSASMSASGPYARALSRRSSSRSPTPAILSCSRRDIHPRPSRTAHDDPTSTRRRTCARRRARIRASAARRGRSPHAPSCATVETRAADDQADGIRPTRSPESIPAPGSSRAQPAHTPYDLVVREDRPTPEDHTPAARAPRRTSPLACTRPAHVPRACTSGPPGAHPSEPGTASSSSRA